MVMAMVTEVMVEWAAVLYVSQYDEGTFGN